MLPKMIEVFVVITKALKNVLEVLVQVATAVKCSAARYQKQLPASRRHIKKSGLNLVEYTRIDNSVGYYAVNQSCITVSD